MPLYTVDNPSKDFDKAAEAAKTLLGDNLVDVSCINRAMPSRVTVETENAIDSSELSIALAKLVPTKAADTPDAKGAEVNTVSQPSAPEEPAAPAATPEPAAPAATPEPAVAVPTVAPVKVVP